MFEKTRLIVAQKLLRKKTAKLKRQKMLFDFASAKYVGIICASEDETSINILKSFLHFLQQKKIKYLVLGYFNGKHVPENFLYWKEMEFITQNELNFFFIPKGSIVNKFIAEPFDMMINCSMTNYFPVEYIAQTSIAKCKVGLPDGDGDYDLMIDIKQKNIRYFLENIQLYLSHLRTRTDFV
jgi:hypothetical protein